jgi:hypothetical protein
MGTGGAVAGPVAGAGVVAGLAVIRWKYSVRETAKTQTEVNTSAMPSTARLVFHLVRGLSRSGGIQSRQ